MQRFRQSVSMETPHDMTNGDGAVTAENSSENRRV